MMNASKELRGATVPDVQGDERKAVKEPLSGRLSISSSKVLQEEAIRP